MKLLAKLIICLVLTTGIAFAQGEEDVSLEYYENLAKQSVEFKDVFKQLKDYKVVLVPGFLSNVIVQVGGWPLFKRLKLGQYFDDQLSLLRSHGIEATRIQTESEGSVEYNAELLRKEIQKSKKPVLFIGHSKGNIDILHFLLKYPDYLGQVKGWVSLQAPFKGSPLADLFQSNRTLHKVAVWLLRKLGGSAKALNELSVEGRKSYNEEHMREIHGINQEIPVLSYGSFVEPSTSFWKCSTPLWCFRNYITKKTGEINDGIVSANSARLLFSPYIEQPGVDHADPVMYTPGRTFDRTKMTAALCSMVLARL